MSDRRHNSEARSEAAAREAVLRDPSALTPITVGETRVLRVSTGYRAIRNMGAPFYCVDGWGRTEAGAVAAMESRVAEFERRLSGRPAAA